MRHAACLTAATGPAARLEAVTRPSGYLERDVPGSVTATAPGPGPGACSAAGTCRSSHLVVAGSRPSRGVFQAEEYPLRLRESSCAQVHEVRLRTTADKPFTLEPFTL